MMSGRRVWCGPVMENWLTASHSLRAGSAQSIRRTKSPRVSPSRLVLHRHAGHQQAVELPVGGQQHRRAQVHHLLERVVARRRAARRGSAWRSASAQPIEQQHLAVVGSLGRGAVGRHVGAVAVL